MSPVLKRQQFSNALISPLNSQYFPHGGNFPPVKNPWSIYCWVNGSVNQPINLKMTIPASHISFLLVAMVTFWFWFLFVSVFCLSRSSGKQLFTMTMESYIRDQIASCSVYIEGCRRDSGVKSEYANLQVPPVILGYSNVLFHNNMRGPNETRMISRNGSRIVGYSGILIRCNVFKFPPLKFPPPPSGIWKRSQIPSQEFENVFRFPRGGI